MSPEPSSAPDHRALWHVPHHETLVRRPRRHPYALCVFVINEGERIHRQLGRMHDTANLADIIIADGGSMDGSLTPDRLEGTPVRALLTKRDSGRLGAQMRMAMAWALDEGYQGVIVMDGNDKDDPDGVPRFVDALECGADHVQGSRWVPGGKAIRTPPLRWVGVRALHAPLISLAAGVRYTDTTNGFRAYSRRFLTDERVAPFREVFSGYELHYYLAIRAGELGFDVREVPVTRAYPEAGPTPTKLTPIRGSVTVLERLWASIRHRFDPDPTHPYGPPISDAEGATT